MIPRKKRRRWRVAIACLPPILCGVVLAADRVFPPDLSRLNRVSVILLDRDDRLLDGHVSRDGSWRLATRVDQVDPAYLRLLLRTEDRRFAEHPGIDPLAMGRAVLQRIGRGRIVSGGSTLAMQAARLLSPHPHDLRGKLIDMLRATQLEWRLGRKGVLDTYLTLAPEGRNVEGIRAASLLYFGHEPARLTPREAAILVALPRRPAALDPTRYPRRLCEAAIGVLRRADANVPKDVDAPALRRVPHESPHLLATLVRTTEATDVVRTTIDVDLQSRVFATLRMSATPARGELAAIVLRHDRSVAAWVGGNGSGPGESIDMITARRSPGSALKPFIYGLAFGDGSLTPETLVDDRRMRLGNYAPHDFDRVFHGTVSAAEALRQSFNLPAVAVLESVGPSRFAAALKNVGIHLGLPRGASPSLALALGGDSIAPLDLAALYAGLPHGGRVAPARVLADLPDRAGTQLLTASAARSLIGVLQTNSPPDGASAGDRVIAFKTGTSYGERDAWAAGVSPDWTVVVWAGRPDGTAVPGITGRETAAPVMEHLFDLLPPDKREFGAVPRADLDTTGLSPSLRQLRTTGEGPQIVYPPPGTVIESRRDDGSMTPVGLEAAGGTPPYRWMINGTPVAVLPGGEPTWTPDGIGFAHVAVTDDDDRTSAVELRVR